MQGQSDLRGLGPQYAGNVGRAVDVIVSVGGEPVAAAVKTATSAIPIVSGFGGDPVEAGLVASLARPGGNLTGFTLLTAELTAKRLGLLSELVPRAGTVALLVDPSYPPSERIVRDAQETARKKGGLAPDPSGEHRSRNRWRFW